MPAPAPPRQSVRRGGDRTAATAGGRRAARGDGLMAEYVEIVPGVVQVPVLGAQVWLLTAGPLTLVDTGTRGSGRAILRAIARLGYAPADLAAIVLTHYHPDHVGALPELLAALAPAPRVAIHAAEAPYLRAPAALPNPFQPPVLRALVQPFWRHARLARPSRSTRRWPTATRSQGAPTRG